MIAATDAIAGPLDGRALPLIDADNAPFFDAAGRGVLRLQQCVDTGRLQYYPRPRSLFTGGEVRWVDVSGTGSIYSFTISRQNYAQPAFHAITPYIVALIDLDEGVRIMGNIIGCPVDTVAIGMAVKACFACVDVQSGLHLPFWQPEPPAETA